MKNLLTIVSVFLISSIGFSQAEEQGNFVFSIGAEIGYYKDYDVTTSFFSVDSSYQDTTAAYFFPITVEYHITNRISAGLSFRPGAYFISEEDKNKGEDNNTTVVDLFASYHFIQKERFDLYGRAEFGSSRLSINQKDPTAESYYQGGHLGLAGGARFYLGQQLFLGITGGWHMHNFKLRDFEVNGQTISAGDFDQQLKVQGWQFSARIGFKL